MNKNITFFLALIIVGLTCTEQNLQAAAKEYTLEYTCAAKDAHDSKDFNQATQKLLNLFETLQRNPEANGNFYEKILSFIAELQTAIIAGVNLFSTSSTSNSEIIATINQTAESADEIVATVEQIQEVEQIIPTAQPTTQTAPTDAAATVEASAPATSTQDTQDAAPVATKALATPKLQFAITISCDNPEKDDLFETLKTDMNALADIINNQPESVDEITKMFNDIIVRSQQLGSNNKLCVNIVA